MIVNTLDRVTRTQRRVRRVQSVDVKSSGVHQYVLARSCRTQLPVDATRPVFNIAVTDRAVVETGISWMTTIIHHLSDIKLGLYRGVPLPRRSSTYSGVLPDKISIFGGPITRLAAGDADRLRREVRHVVLHEIAHHFGISDERLIELDRY